MKKVRITAIVIAAAVLVSGFAFTASAASGRRELAEGARIRAGAWMRLESLVKAGTITAEQAKAVKAAASKAAYSAASESLGEALASLKSSGTLTEEQAKAVADAAAAQTAVGKAGMNLLKKLIDDNTITRKQASEIVKAFLKVQKEKLPSAVKSAVGALVSEGTITQAQADAILSPVKSSSGHASSGEKKTFRGRTRTPVEKTSRA